MWACLVELSGFVVVSGVGWGFRGGGYFWCEFDEDGFGGLVGVVCLVGVFFVVHGVYFRKCVRCRVVACCCEAVYARLRV